MSLSDVIQSHINATVDNLYTTMPGKITKIWKKGSSTVVDVKPLLNNRARDGQVIEEDGLSGLPVIWPQGGNSYITFPLEVGDNVAIHFSMRNMMEWKNGDGVKPVTPVRRSLHSLNNAFVVPGLLPYSQGVEIDSEAVRIASDKTEIRILKDGTIELGEGATEAILKGDAFKTYLDQIITALISHTHPVSGSTAAASPGLATLQALPEEVLSTVSKTK
jgi:hypothetical protein